MPQEQKLRNAIIELGNFIAHTSKIGYGKQIKQRSHQYGIKYRDLYRNVINEFSEFKKKFEECSESLVTLENQFNSLAEPSSPQDMIESIKIIEETLNRFKNSYNKIDQMAYIFPIPKNLPDNVRKIVEEAENDYRNCCFYSSIVMARRAYEEMLTHKYKEINKTDKLPLQEVICSKCKTMIRKHPLSVSCLNDWAFDKKLIRDRCKNNARQLIDFGAGGAHPPEEKFPGDEIASHIQLANLSLLLSDLSENE